jgi:hypothetical protein
MLAYGRALTANIEYNHTRTAAASAQAIACDAEKGLTAPSLQTSKKGMTYNIRK